MSNSDRVSDAKPDRTDDSEQVSWTKSPWLKLGIALVVEISVVLVVFFTPVRGWLGLGNARTIMHNFQTWRENLGILAPLAYMLTYVVATVFAIPGSALTLASGAIFGAIQGTIWTVIGATLGATGAFMASRFLIGGTIAKRFDRGDRLSQLVQGIKENGFWFALSIRLAPIFPFNAVNYLFGVTPIRLSSYFFATFIGIIPGTLVYSWLGQEGAEALTGNARWQLPAALVALSALSATPLLMKRLKRSV
ncbi:TVP38/TMEM64 family protein [Pseudanabaena sp. PCC 6802]|uniref:TVP38/TMEM64 family protein n=1 Tax=Pseudanabaena sp. PCC 6802 TaxID=118173 RepID=UPI000347E916|nr:TVP38/TMEM64 family protein [Pseudanabaena sp. PCC 6802]